MFDRFVLKIMSEFVSPSNFDLCDIQLSESTTPSTSSHSVDCFSMNTEVDPKTIEECYERVFRKKIEVSSLYHQTRRFSSFSPPKRFWKLS